jgi:anti-sigma B factor antagonist
VTRSLLSIGEMPMEMKTRKQGRYAVVALTGEIDLQCSPQVREEILHRLDERQSVLVDLSQVTYIDSSGIASLVEGLQHARGRRLEFALVGIQDAVMQVFKLTRLDAVFPMHASLEAAMSG